MDAARVEYGQRVGIWRLFDTFDKLKVPASCTINAKTALIRPDIANAPKERGWEVVAHNYEQGELLTDFAKDPKKEREIIEATLKVYKEFYGKPAKGWLSSSLRGTVNTPAGIVLNIGGRTIYHLGDTALFSDLALPGQRHSLDLALIPIGGRYTMDRHDAVRAAALIGAPRIVPIHHNTFAAIDADAEAFADAVAAEGIATVTILDPGQSLELA